ncbi:MAG: hypothetical protein Q9218_004421, partial [Villophora microphyllina]
YVQFDNLIPDVPEPKKRYRYTSQPVSRSQYRAHRDPTCVSQYNCLGRNKFHIMPGPGIGAFIKGRLYPPAQITHSFAGKTVIVTGSNTGLGYETALKYVELQASTVILAVRSVPKGTRAKELIEGKTGRKGVVQVWELDMDRFASVESFAERVETSLPKLDILVLNAGVVCGQYSLSSEGWERTLQVNTISTALLAILLMPKLQRSSTSGDLSHLEIVSSEGYQGAVTTPRGSERRLHERNEKALSDGSMAQYFQSKLFIMWITRVLAERCVQSDGSPTVIINDTCPGACRSEGFRDFQTNIAINLVLPIVQFLFFKTAEQGARTIVGATTLGVESHGKFWVSSDEFKT